MTTFSDLELRNVMGHFATGVTIVCAIEDDVPAGFTVNSFTSVSLNPPLVLFCPHEESYTWPIIERVGTFSVNLLSEGQLELSRKFALPTSDRFEGVDWRPAPNGSPIIIGSIGWLECDLDAVYPGGDHLIAVGRVTQIELSNDPATPLVFFGGEFGTMG